MKNAILALLVALVATATVKAQQIAVVSESGETTLYRTLQKAIEGALSGSVIYLSGGGFTIADSVKITNKLTIIGIGHKSNNDNVDGSTIISGNIFFNEGSSGSAVMGCYITGNVNIGEGGASVNDVLVRYCSLNSVQVHNSTCSGTIINQNYIRGDYLTFNHSSAIISNNILAGISNLDSGKIVNNNFYLETGGSWGSRRLFSNINNTIISGNIFHGSISSQYFLSGSGCQISGNLCFGSTWGDNPINIEGTPQDVFVDVNGWANSPFTDFHFTEDYKEYENQVGIYAGTGFHDEQLAPVPYIVAKSIPEQTDASGKLNIKIRVKAGE